jgi:transposase
MTTSSPVRERRDIQALEKRRKKAIRYFVRDISQAEVARRLTVSRTAVHYWHTAWKKKGARGLKSKRGVFGRVPRLTEKKIEKVKIALLEGPRKAGYETDLWTLQRIAALIKKKVRISYHPNHVWRVLHSLGFTCQIPEAKPKERNEKAIKEWRARTWPAIQKKGSKPAPA